MGKKMLMLGIIIIVLFTVSCSSKTDQELFTDLHKHLLGIEGYSCKANIIIYAENGETKFEALQWYKSPNKYRIEIVEDQQADKMIMVYNGKEGWIYNPASDNTLVFEDFYRSGERAMFVGSFTGNFLETEKLEYGTETIGKIKYITMKLKVPGGNNYVDSQKIWLTAQGFKPFKMEIYNSKGNKAMEISYSEFEYNAKLQDTTFDL